MSTDKAQATRVGTLAREIDPRVVVLAAPRSAAAEQFRVLARRIERRIAAGSNRIGVTSAIAGEGRSTTAVNLAVALGANGGRRVVIVDAHLRAPTLDRLLQLEPRAGLVDVVLAQATLDEALVRGCAALGDEGLWALTAGFAPDPHQLFAAPRLSEVMAELAERFDAVIVDTPPVLPTADLLGLARSLDSLLMVVRARRTPKELVAAALEAIAEVPLLGWVLNGVEAGAGPPFRLFQRHDREARQGARPQAAPVAATVGWSGS